MQKFLAGAGGQIFALVCMSFGAGALAMTAFEKFLRSDSSAWYWGGLTLLFCFSICINALRLRKAMP